MEREAGVEPAASTFGRWRSVRLSYSRKLLGESPLSPVPTLPISIRLRRGSVPSLVLSHRFELWLSV